MTNLNDKQIRNGLICKLNSQRVKPKAIIEELRVHNGNAIADVVALYEHAHCFEIKGDNDKIERISAQGYYYNVAFKKITLVTTKKHLGRALSIAPGCWGLMIAEEKDGEIFVANYRKAKNNSSFCKKLALLTLWKSEMQCLLSGEVLTKTNLCRNLLAQRISESLRKDDLSNKISSLLYMRCQNDFQLA